MKRYSYITPVMVALDNAGISRTLLINAVNAELGKAELVDSEDKVGYTTVTKSKKDGTPGKSKFTRHVAEKYQTGRSSPLTFDAWAGKLEQSYKIAQFDTVGLPPSLEDWLEKLQKATDKMRLETAAAAAAIAAAATAAAPPPPPTQTPAQAPAEQPA